MMSPRYASAVLALLVISLVPTIIHSYVGATVVDGRTAAAAVPDVEGFTSADTNRKPGWGEHEFDSSDWTERSYSSPGEEVVLTVVRSYDPKKLYHHPELSIADRKAAFTQHSTMRVAGRPDMPIHVLQSDQGPGAVAMYVLDYDDQFVEDPIRFQLLTAGQLLFSGRKAMTLLFALDTAAEADADLGASPTARVLEAAVDRFISQERP